MSGMQTRERRTFEVMLMIVIAGMTYLLCRMGASKMVVLNLFYLPIVLSGYFLGRGSAGMLALLSVFAVSIAVTLDPSGFAVYNSPVMIGLALTVWGAVLGLAAILVGTLCDERAKTVEELHAAYVGVVEVLSRYLQCANPTIKARSTRIAELSQAVAEKLRLSRKQVDDIRVGALLHDLGNVEITTQLLSKAVDTLESNQTAPGTHTFSGQDLMHSLGSVLSGAMPLLINQDDAIRECLTSDTDDAAGDVPIGAKIIRAVRGYDELMSGESGPPAATPRDAVQELRKDVAGAYDPDVLAAIERCIPRTSPSSKQEPTYA